MSKLMDVLTSLYKYNACIKKPNQSPLTSN